MKWAYGVTTVPARRKGCLSRTLVSLCAAGFPEPRLFVDGDRDGLSWQREFERETTARYPATGIVGAWMLAAWELYMRNPAADRFAVFQDDLTAYRNLRKYLEGSWPERGYVNMFTFRENERIASRPRGWYEGADVEGGSGQVYHGKRQQSGRGAVALAFTREAFQDLLRSDHLVRKPLSAAHGDRRVDGSIVEAMNKAGWREYVHNPSLVQHTGDVSTIGNRRGRQALTFLGESYDATDLLRPRVPGLAVSR